MADSIQAAENLKYTSAIKWVLADLMKRPHDAFVRFVLDQVHGGLKTKVRVEQFRGLTRQAFREFISPLLGPRTQRVGLKGALPARHTRPGNARRRPPQAHVSEQTATARSDGPESVKSSTSGRPLPPGS